MKKITVTIIISLVMCLSMAFPASAATITDTSLTSKYDPIIEEFLKQKPSGYNYYIILIVKTGINSVSIPDETDRIFIYYLKSPVGPPSTIYEQFYTNSYNFNTGSYAYTTPYLYNGRTMILREEGYYFKPPAFHLYASDSNSGLAFSYYVADRSTAKFYDHDKFESDFYKNINWQVRFDVYTTALQSLITTAKVKQDVGYSSTTWQVFQNAITAAESLLSTTGYTQTEIDFASSALNAAISGLTLNAVTPPTPPVLGFDLGSGNISGFLAPALPLFSGYVLSIMPVVISFFSIYFGIKLLPFVFKRIMNAFRR